MQRSDLTIDMPQILSILNAIAGQLDFRSVIQAVSSEIKALRLLKTDGQLKPGVVDKILGDNARALYGLN